MTEEQLQEIEGWTKRLGAGRDDVAALIAEVRLLRSQRDKTEELAITRHGMWQAAEKRAAELSQALEYFEALAAAEPRER